MLPVGHVGVEQEQQAMDDNAVDDNVSVSPGSDDGDEDDNTAAKVMAL